MRRIDVITVSLAIFVGGGLLYIVFQAIGLDGLSAGVWSQALLVDFKLSVSSGQQRYDLQSTTERLRRCCITKTPRRDDPGRIRKIATRN